MNSDLKIFLSEIDSRVNENMEYSSDKKYLFDSSVCYCDGFNDTNPGTKGGWTIASYYNDKETLFSVYTIEKENFTNNEAELLGVLYAARFANNNTTNPHLVCNFLQSYFYVLWSIVPHIQFFLDVNPLNNNYYNYAHLNYT